MSKTITIEITGLAHTGKTTVAALIYKMLHQYGATDVEVECMDGDVMDKVGRNIKLGDLTEMPKFVIKDNNAINKSGEKI